MSVLRVDVWSDVVCPWCYIGLANLEEATRDLPPGIEVEVVTHSYQLDPGAPVRDEGSVADRLARKYGTSVAQIRAQQARIVDLGAERGIDFRFDQSISGNTFDAHRLLHLARERGLQMELKHALGRAYFTDGQPIGEKATVRAAAIAVGLDADEVDAVLATDAYAAEVRQDLEAGQEIGISGVPFFVVDGRLGLSGAQPPETLRKVIDRALADRAPAIEVVADGEGDACGPEGCAV